jgi:hypothetical protein
MADEVVVGATRKNLVATIVDSDGLVVNLTGGAVRMEGRSSDLPAISLDVAGTLTDPAQGKVTFAALGTLVSQANLTAAGIAEATFRLRIKYTDAAAKVDFGPIFEIKWVKDPLTLTP